MELHVLPLSGPVVCDVFSFISPDVLFTQQRHLCLSSHLKVEMNTTVTCSTYRKAAGSVSARVEQRAGLSDEYDPHIVPRDCIQQLY